MSHILVVDSNLSVAQNVVKILERSGSEVDERLRRMSIAQRKDVDLRRQRSLCHSLKAMGVCMYVYMMVLRINRLFYIRR